MVKFDFIKYLVIQSVSILPVITSTQQGHKMQLDATAYVICTDILSSR